MQSRLIYRTKAMQSFIKKQSAKIAELLKQINISYSQVRDFVGDRYCNTFL